MKFDTLSHLFLLHNFNVFMYVFRKAALGLVCPIIERRVGKWTTVPVPEWTGVLRCSAFFVGISHASAKVDYPSTFQLALTLAALCAALWWCFDRSISGLGAGLAVAIIAAFITHFYVIKSHRYFFKL